MTKKDRNDLRDENAAHFFVDSLSENNHFDSTSHKLSYQKVQFKLVRNFTLWPGCRWSNYIHSSH